MTLNKTTVVLAVLALILLISSIGFSLFVESRTLDNNAQSNYVEGNPEGHVNIIVIPPEETSNISK